MNTISFITANFVAREVGFDMHGWGHGDKAANEYYQPLETFGERFDDLLRTVRAMDFDAIDLWLAHLSPAWATDEHLQLAAELLDKHELRVVSLAGWFGSTPDEFERSCEIARAVNTSLLGGRTSMLEQDRSFMLDMLQKYELKLGIENHPEKTPQDLLAQIGDDNRGVVGATVDTGWFGTQGYAVPRAIEQLREHLFHVHLKDVLHVGEPHETCGYGKGIVPLRECVETLKRIGFRGAIAIENEPEHYDPTPEILEAREMVRQWLNEG